MKFGAPTASELNISVHLSDYWNPTQFIQIFRCRKPTIIHTNIEKNWGFCENTRARCMWKAFCWRPAIPAARNFSSSSTPLGIILLFRSISTPVNLQVGELFGFCGFVFWYFDFSFVTLLPCNCTSEQWVGSGHLEPRICPLILIKILRCLN